MIYQEHTIKCRNPKRKSAPLQRFNAKKFMTNVGGSYELKFIKQVPVHPKDRIVRAAKKGTEQ